MPRRPRVSILGYAEHIIQRGNNRQPIFACDEDIKTYAYWFREYAEKIEVSNTCLGVYDQPCSFIVYTQ
jgi:putative transposase